MYFVVCKRYETIFTISVEIFILLLTTKEIKIWQAISASDFILFHIKKAVT